MLVMRIKKSSKLGQIGLQQAPGIVVTLVVIAVVLGVGATILDEVGATQGVNTTASNITEDGLTGINTFSGFQPVMAVIAVAAIILTLLLGGLAVVAVGRGR